jgi:hypothetical protein
MCIEKLAAIAIQRGVFIQPGESMPGSCLLVVQQPSVIGADFSRGGLMVTLMFGGKISSL